MIIGIDASRAFLKRRTGIEAYAYQVIKHLRGELASEQVVLYVRKQLAVHNGRLSFSYPSIDFELPKRWRVKGIWAPRFWTQIRLSLEMLLHPPDVLFVPAHTVPIIHPARKATRFGHWLFFIIQKLVHPLTGCSEKHSVAGGPTNTIVTIHGLEYEFCPHAYSLWERLYMRHSIRFSVRAASKVICVSENTKRDVMRLYGISEEKIRVIYEGFERIKNQESKIKNEIRKPYLFFVGRLEARKNLQRIIKAFEILKITYGVPHDLVLVGKPGHGYKSIQLLIRNSQFSIHIQELGYVSGEEKWSLLQNADVFLFPTLYEGFGIPVIEAQAAGVPVVTARVSALPEVAGTGAVYVDPLKVESIAEGIQTVLSDKVVRDGIIVAGEKNIERFDWGTCAAHVALLLIAQKS